LSGLRSTLLNIPDKKKNGLAESPNYRDLYIKTPVMMHSIDADGRLLEVNDFWAEVLGYEREEVIGNKLTAYLSESSSRMAEHSILPQFFLVGFVKDIPYQMVRKNGEIIDVLISATSEKDDSGQVLHSMAGVLDVTERRKSEKENYYLAHFDHLTDTPNRFLLRDRLKQNLAQAAREGHQVAVLFIDLDRFKAVNDTMGHLAGDELLKIVGLRLKECVRDMDTVGRFGGDEFVVILYGILSEDDPAVFAGRILDALARPARLDGKDFVGSASIGIAIFPEDGQDEDVLLRNADTAMYAAKQISCNSYQFFSAEMAAKAHEKHHLENNLRSALERDEFSLVYQPQFDLGKNRIAGFEALIRWNHPTKGTISPAQFIPVAEETGLILPLGEWVLRTACTQARTWQDAGFPAMRMAVNISTRQFNRRDFVEILEATLRDTGLDPQCLEIELTETTVMDKIHEAIAILTDIKLLNVSLAIDDFGTGFSSLIYLKQFPFDRIKIAQEFVRDLSHDPADKAIVEAIISMSHRLNLDVIAEGVETKEQLNFLKNRNCLEVQGYYLGRPASAHSIPSSYFPKSAPNRPGAPEYY
jgi:diguanylate cyclase (GGDEF)-like protein/PAS domain S-box-containing protein